MRKSSIKRVLIGCFTAVSVLTGSVVNGAVLPPEDIAETVFYASAEINGKNIKVNFSKSPAVTDFSSVAVYNTLTGNKVSTDEPIAMGSSLMITVKEELEKSVEYCVVLPEDIKSQSGEGIYSSYVYFVSEMDKNKAQNLALVNDTFDTYTNSPSKQNIPENWFVRQQGSYNEFKFYSDSEHDKAFQLAINGWVPIVATRNFGKTLDKQFTIEFDYMQTAMNKYITGEEDPNLIQAVYDATKLSVPSLASIEKLNLNMGFRLAPVAESGEKRKDSKGNDLGPSSFSGTADTTFVSNDKLTNTENFFQLYGDRLGFGNWTLPKDGNFVRITTDKWYHIVLEMDMEKLQVVGYINNEKIGPYNLPSSYKDAQHGAVAARATFYMDNPVKFPIKGGSVTYIDYVTGEEKTYSKNHDSNFVIDNFKVITEVPEFKLLQTRLMAVDNEEFAPLQNINAVINKMRLVFSSAVDLASIKNDTLTVTDDGGNIYEYSVSEYDKDNNTVELTFAEPLTKGKKYTVAANGIKSDLKVVSEDYQTTFTLEDEGSLYISDTKATDSVGNEITGAVTAGNTVYFDGHMADSTGRDNVINLILAAYKTDDNGVVLTECASKSITVNKNEKVINTTKEPLKLTLSKNADYVKAYVCITDGYTSEDTKIKANVTSNKVTISGNAAPGETINIDIPASGDDYLADKNCAMVYRDITTADEDGVYTFDISATDIATGEYLAYVYTNKSKTADKCEFIYSKNSDVIFAASAVNNAEDKAKELSDQYVKLGVDSGIYKAGDNTKAAKILENYGKLSETDAAVVKNVLNEIYLITAIDKGGIVNLFDYDGVLDFGRNNIKNYLSKKYVTEEFEKGVTADLKGENFESVNAFYDKLTEKFVLAVVGVNDGYGNAEEIIKAYENKIGVDADELTVADYKKVTGSKYENFAELKSALGSKSTGTSKPANNNKPTGTSGGGGYSSDTKLPAAEQTEDNNSPLPYDIFEDIDDVIWAKPAIVYLAEQGIINGTSKTTFSPNDFVKREEIVKIIVNTYLADKEEGVADFDDVDKDEWYYSFVAKAYANGIVNGYSDKIFGIGDDVTRQDLAVMIYNAATANGEKFETKSDIKFSDDGRIADYAKTAVYALRDAGAINGVDDDNFAPTEKATRAEAAKIIYSLIKL